MKKERATGYRQYGITLVELMIAMVLGLFVVAGLVQVYVSNKQAYRVNEALARIQENARFAMQFIARDLRFAGFRGCGGREISVQGTGFDLSTPIKGFEATGSSVWSPANTVAPAASSGHDIVQLKGPLGRSWSCGGTTAFPFSSGDKVLVASCSDARIITAGASYSCAGREDLFGLETHVYYLKNNSAGEPALYVRVDGVDRELVEGVEDMQLLYGIDTDGDQSANKYVKADVVETGNDWGNVLSVRVQLLLRSLSDRVTDQATPYTFNGTTVTPTDRRIRRVFISTVDLRNLTP